MTQRVMELGVAALVGGAIAYALTRPSSSPSVAQTETSKTEQVVRAFLHAQSKRDLDEMCSLIADNIVYINEPHPPERAIRGKEMFRAAFAD